MELRRTSLPDHTLVERLCNDPRETGLLLRRMVGEIRTADRADFFLGTSDYPVEVQGDYMNHHYRFRELGSWLGLELTTADNAAALEIGQSISLVTPIC